MDSKDSKAPCLCHFGFPLRVRVARRMGQDEGIMQDEAGRPTLAEKVRFLRTPGACGGETAVKVIETHMSWVFLTDGFVYKLKKPVRYPFLDFATVAARGANCREEVRLNAPLAPGVYLGTVALTVQGDGGLAIGGGGRTVDWLVKMRRLPEHRMLDLAIAEGSVTRPEVEQLADVLAAFYRQAPAVSVPAGDFLAHFRSEQRENRTVLCRPEFGLPRRSVVRALGAVDGFLDRRADLLADRVRNGHVVEGHGDLRPEHVCLLSPPVIFDRLEFNRTFRLVDPFDELAYFALECTRLGAGWIGDLVIDRVDGVRGVWPADPLMAFYTAFRALLRARLALNHLLEPEPRTPAKWLPLARAYLAIAARAAARLSLPAGRRQTRPRDSA